MWKPDENLDDYMGTPAPKVAPEPPPSVSLKGTGQVTLLKPLARAEVRTGFSLIRSRQSLWFRRLLVAGSAALVMVALVLVSAILVGIDDRPAGPDIASNAETVDAASQTEELYNLDLSIPLTFLPATRELVRSNVRRRPNRPILLAVNKPRRQLRPPLRPEEPNFIPTTLVIYAQNGVITSRIEPWLQVSDK